MPDQYDRSKHRQTNIRLSKLGNALLDTLVEYYGVTKTDAIEIALRGEARQLGLLVRPEPVACLERVDGEDDS